MCDWRAEAQIFKKIFRPFLKNKDQGDAGMKSLS